MLTCFDDSIGAYFATRLAKEDGVVEGTTVDEPYVTMVYTNSDAFLSVKKPMPMFIRRSR